MVAIKMEGFGGAVPVLSRRLLADNMADVAVNVDVLPGEIRPIPRPVEVVTLTGGTFVRAVAIPDRGVPGTFVWVGMTSTFGRVFRSPLVNDAFERFIKLDGNSPGTPTRLMVNSFSRIKAGSPWLKLGMPAPNIAPALAVAGGSGAVITRSYIYTLVNMFGEESQPSAPVTVSGFANGTWNLSSLAAPVDAADYGITAFRIYRTITGNTGTDYFLVAEQLIASTTYADTRLDSVVASEGRILRSVAWAAPLDVEGVLPLPNGFFAAWSGRNVYFSEPYRPWAWPAAYTLSTPHPVTGCGVFGNSLVALTETTPVIFTGNVPASMSVAQAGFIEPCESPGSVVSTPEGVYFAGRSGIYLVGPGGATNVTRNIVGLRQWRDQYLPDHKYTVVTPRRIIGYGAGGRGFSIDKEEARAGLIQLRSSIEYASIWQDELFSRIYGIADNVVYELESGEQNATSGGWRSKEFVFPRPMGFGALLLSIDSVYDAETQPPFTPNDPVVPGGPWTGDNTTLYNYAQFNGAPYNDAPLPGTLPPGASPPAYGWPSWYGALQTAVAFDLAGFSLPDGIDAYVTVYADRKPIWSRAVTGDRQYRLPSGFKSEVWQFEVVSRVAVYSLIVGETGKDLADV